jgi:hypothetical protein
MLRVTGENLDSLLDDPNVVVGVLEAGIAAAAEASATIIDRELEGQPLLAVVLKATAREFAKAGNDRVLFRKVANGDLLQTLYRATLKGIAANPKALASELAVEKHVAVLIAACASELSKKPLLDALSPETVRGLAARVLAVMSREPALLAAHGEFAARTLGAALATAAHALKDGLTRDDLVDIAEAVARQASANLGLLPLNDRLAPVVEALSQTLADEGLAALTSGGGRKQLFLAGLQAVAANPRIWQRLAEQDLAAPLVAAVIRAIAASPPGLLPGPTLAAVLGGTLQAAARRGKVV